MSHGTRSRRAGPAALIATVLALTTACTAFGPRSNVTIEEYEAQSEELGATLTATIEDVPRDPDGPDGPNDVIASQAVFVDAEGGARQNNPWKYWIWERGFTFAEDSGTTPQEAADRMAQILEDGGWTAGKKDPGETVGKYEYRRPDDDNSNGWYVGISFRHKVRQVDITVVSPSTDASDGSAEAARDFEDAATRLETALDDLDVQVQAARPHAYFSDDKATYLDGLQRWKTASAEVHTMIQLVRESLRPAPAVDPGTAGDLR